MLINSQCKKTNRESVMLGLIPMKAGQRASVESFNVTGVGEYLYRNDLLLKKLYGCSVRLISLFYFGPCNKGVRQDEQWSRTPQGRIASSYRDNFRVLTGRR